MTLDYNFSKVKKYQGNEDAWIEVTSFGEKGWDIEPVMKGLIFGGGMVGLQSITKSNASEWYARIKICEEFLGLFITRKWENNEIVDVPLKKEVLAEYVGLSTNHSIRNRSEWIKNLKKNNKEIEPTASELTNKLKRFVEEFDK